MLRALLCSVTVAVVSAGSCDLGNLEASGYTQYTTDFTGNPKGTKFNEVDLTEKAEKPRGVHIFDYNDPNDVDDVPESLLKFLQDRLKGKISPSVLLNDFTRTFLKGWHRNTISITTGNDKYAYLEVSKKETASTWTWARDHFTAPATWMLGSVANNAGISADLVTLLCESAADTIFFADDNQLSFSAVGNTQIMAIRCSRPLRAGDDVAPSCADDAEITVDGPSFDYTHVAAFFVGVLLIVQAVELSKEGAVWTMGVSACFFVFLAYLVLKWVRNQGHLAKYTTAAVGMWGAAMSNVLLKHTNIIFSVVVQHNYLMYAFGGMCVLSLIGAKYFEPKETSRDIISDIMLNFVGIFIMSQYEPCPYAGVVVGGTLAIAVHMYILLNLVSGFTLAVLTSIQHTLSAVLKVFLYPLKPIIWTITQIWKVLVFFGPKPKKPIRRRVNVTAQEYAEDGQANTGMEMENLRHTHIDTNSRLWRRTTHVEPGADTAGALSPAKGVRKGFSRFDNIARSRGTTPQQARLHSRLGATMKPSHELGDDDITEEEMNAAFTGNDSWLNNDAGWEAPTDNGKF